MSAPTALNQLEITAVSYGGSDFTNLTRQKFQEALQSTPTLRSWSFQAGNEFFGDPNPTINKAFVVVYRSSIQSADGTPVWSQFTSTAGMEGDTVTLYFDSSALGDHTATLPAPDSSALAIVGAFWLNKDVTSNVQQQLKEAALVSGQSLYIFCDAQHLGTDPSPGGLKQLTVVYASYVYPGKWTYSVSVRMGTDPNKFSSTVPGAFPPAEMPNDARPTSFVTFNNRAGGIPMSPRIYRKDGTLQWDGAAMPNNDFYLTGPSSKDVQLISRAGCQEGEVYYVGFVKLDSHELLSMVTTTMVQASRAPEAAPVTVSWGATIVPGPSMDFSNPARPCQYYAADLRLNIYAASWGSSEVTEFIKDNYIGSTLKGPPNNPPNSKRNVWSFTPSGATLGPDPNPGIGKAFVVIYRVAYVVDHKAGQYTDYDYPVWSDLYYAENESPLYTDNYPVLQDVSGFRVAAVRDGQLMTIDLLGQDLSPQIHDGFWGTSDPWIVKAVYSTVDVTHANSDTQRPFHMDRDPKTGFFTGEFCDQSITPSDLNNGVDPWPNNRKQVTYLVGYPQWPVYPEVVDKVEGPPYIWRTYIQMESGHGNDKLALPLQLFAPYTQAPAAFNPLTTGKTASKVTFKNSAGVIAYPKIYLPNDKTWWRGRTANESKWRMLEGQSKTVDLVNDSYCKTNGTYYLGFDYMWAKDPPTRLEVVVSGNPNETKTITAHDGDNINLSGKTSKDTGTGINIALTILSFL